MNKKRRLPTVDTNSLHGAAMTDGDLRQPITAYQHSQGSGGPDKYDVGAGSIAATAVTSRASGRWKALTGNKIPYQPA